MGEVAHAVSNPYPREVGWSCGNPFYYAYGFNITIFEPNQEGLTEAFKELER